MTDAELIEFASEFREGILDGRPSNWMCAMVCWPLSSLLEFDGVRNEVVETDLGAMNHFWIKLSDGRVLDPTADQFNDISADKLPPVYLGAPRIIHGAPLLSDGAFGRQGNPLDAVPGARSATEGTHHNPPDLGPARV